MVDVNGQNAANPADTKPLAPVVTVVVDGVEQRVTQDELVKSYELARASRNRMQEAATIRKQTEADVNIAAVLRDFMQNPTQGGFEQLARASGLDDSAVQEASDYINKVVAGQDGNSQPPSDMRVTLDDLAPDVRELLQSVADLKNDRRKGDARNLFNDMIQESNKRVDKDQFFGTMVGEGKTDAVAKAKRYVEREVERRVGLRGEPWPDVLDEIIREARTLFENVSNPDTPNGTNQASAVGPAAAVTSTVRNQEPPKPVDVRDPGYARNVAERLLHTIGRLAKQAKK